MKLRVCKVNGALKNADGVWQDCCLSIRLDKNRLINIWYDLWKLMLVWLLNEMEENKNKQNKNDNSNENEEYTMGLLSNVDSRHIIN